MGLLGRLFGFGRPDESIMDESPNLDCIDLQKKTCPEMNIYKIRGRHPETKRLRTVRRVALEPADQEAVIASSGLYDIQFCEIEEQELPSERQINYAIDLGINLSDDYTKEDISCLITRAVHEEDRDDMIPVDLSLAKMVAEHNICLSIFSGEKRALNALWFQLSKEEQLKFFIFCIHQNRLKCHSYDLEHSPYLDYYDRFVEEYKDNESLRRSLSGYVGSDLSLNKKPNKQRNAYKIVNEFLIK